LKEFSKTYSKGIRDLNNTL